jgi:spermidine/putrescine transport system substrate-binding protein
MWQRVEVSMTGFDGADAERLSRRQLIGRGAGGLVAGSSLSLLLAACGGGSGGGATTSATATTAKIGPTPASEVTGALKLLGYPDWYGANEFKDFHAKYPGASVKNLASGLTGAAAQVAQLAQNKGSYDLTLAGVNVAEQMQLAKLIEPFQPGAVPNISGVGATFRKAFPYGIPTDFGRTGYAYRKDLIPERPTSWKELWQLAAKYSGKTTMLKYDSDIQGSVLKYLGFSTNSKDPAQLDAMQKALLQIKPHLLAIIDTDYSKQLIQGNAFFAIDYDYDIAAAQQQNKNIVWVNPTEGMTAYLEGWIALNSSKHIPAVWAFMNYHLDPKNYASFVNATGTAYVVPSAQPFIKKSIAEDPILKSTPENLKGVEFEGFLGPDITAKRGKLWEAFLAA